MKTLNLEMNSDNLNYITILLEDKDKKDYSNIHIYDSKTLFLENGYIIRDAVATEFTKHILYNMIEEITVKFTFDNLLTEEEYENS